jgi:diacylglycerol kinase
MTRKKNSIASRLQSIQFAAAGIRQLVKAEPNAKIHAVATVLVITYGCYTGLNRLQWVAIAFAIGLVWITEAVNTAIEMVCDLYCKGAYDPTVKKIKDLSAAAVLIASCISVIVALFIFI